CDGYRLNAIDLQRLKAPSSPFAQDAELAGVQTVQDFDAWIENAGKSLTGFFYRSFVGNCPSIKPDTAPLRYASSVLCAQTVAVLSSPTRAQVDAGEDTSTFCTQNVNSTAAICPQPCDAFAASFVSIVTSSACNLTATQREALTRSWSNFCGRFRGNVYGSASLPCTSGSSLEASSCGFGSTRLPTARTYCTTSNTTDPCCVVVAGTTTTITTRSTTTAIATSAAATTDPTTPAPATSSGGISPALAGAISAVCLVAVAALVVFGIMYHRRRQKSAHALVAAHQKARMDRLEERIQNLTGTGATSTVASSTALSGVAASKDVPPVPTVPSAPSVASNNALVPTPSVVASSAAASTVMPGEATFSALWRVVEAYEPQMGDEVLLQPGELVVLETIYNDGWARGTNQSTRMFGYLPLACLTPVDAGASSTTAGSLPSSTTPAGGVPDLHDRDVSDLPASAAAAAAHTSYAAGVRHSMQSATLRNLTMTNLSRFDGVTGGPTGTIGYPTATAAPPNLGGAGTLTTYNPDVDIVPSPTLDTLPRSRHSAYSATYDNPFTRLDPAASSVPPHGAASTARLSQDAAGVASGASTGGGYGVAAPVMQRAEEEEAWGAGGVGTQMDRTRPVMSALGSLARSTGDSTLDR
ncbi:hypothetical protein HDU96_003844, partial [Phlyctochytrium bullatum]